jgi:hypothetical protein
MYWWVLCPPCKAFITCANSNLSKWVTYILDQSYCSVLTVFSHDKLHASSGIHPNFLALYTCYDIFQTWEMKFKGTLYLAQWWCRMDYSVQWKAWHCNRLVSDSHRLGNKPIPARREIYQLNHTKNSEQTVYYPNLNFWISESSSM